MQTIRTLQFMIKGYRNFTKKETKLPQLTGNLQGKNFVITGANSGIGFAAAKKAAQMKAEVYLICRNKERGEQAVKNIIKQTGNQKVFLILGQMGQKKQMDQVCKSLNQKIKKIDILVHNAGCMIHERLFTEEKLQKNFAANTFAVFYLTLKLLPLLHKQSRTIAVSSGGMLTQKLITDDYFMENQKFDGTAQYARNKRQQICIMEELAKKYNQKGKFVSMHPGWVDTLAVRTSMPDFYKKMKDDLKTQDEGADTILYLASCQSQKIVNGEFYYEREIADKHLTISCTSYKQNQADTLMNYLQKLSS